MSERLASVTEAQRHEALSRANQTLLASLLDAASNAIVLYCGTEIADGSASAETVRGTGLPWIHTENIPIIAFTSATITEDDGSTTSVSSSDVKLIEEQGKICFAPSNSSGYYLWPQADWENISINYTYGYTTVPEGVKQACIFLAESMYAQSSMRDPHLKSFTMGEYSESRGEVGKSELFTPTITLLLEPYRHFREM